MTVSVVYVAVLLSITTCFVTVVSSQRSSKEIDYDFLGSKSFKKIVRSIVQETENVDISCKLEHGLGSYYSYIGECDNCSNHCAGPKADKNQECVSKCLPFIRDVKNQRKYEELERRLEKLSGRLEAQNLIIYIMLGGFGVFLTALTVLGIWYHKRYVQKRIRGYSLNDAQPTSDILAAATPLTMVVQDNGTIDDGYNTRATTRQNTPMLDRQEAL